MEKTYKVLLLVQEMGEKRNRWENVGEPVEIAGFETLEEAQLFQSEVTQKYSAIATGESDILEDMTSGKDFTAGD